MLLEQKEKIMTETKRRNPSVLAVLTRLLNETQVDFRTIKICLDEIANPELDQLLRAKIYDTSPEAPYFIGTDKQKHYCNHLPMEAALKSKNKHLAQKAQEQFNQDCDKLRVWLKNHPY